MLLEFADATSLPDGGSRRWFRSAHEDLIVWYQRDGAIQGFQFCYDRKGYERALTWTATSGYTHHSIDDGESGGLNHKGSPILVADGVFDAEYMTHHFMDIAGQLPQDVVALVSERLQESARHFHPAVPQASVPGNQVSAGLLLPSQFLQQVVDADSFLAFARALNADRTNAVAAAQAMPGIPADPAAQEWNNQTIEAFLGSAIAWAEDSQFGLSQGVPASNPWKQFAAFLYCGKIRD